ncbi:cytosolic phospholipase A2 gamma-like [Pygocentrus nattereri]|uniref:cytosolic phospholipase A2 gamma-like n=1 Tax=Pygocentrus nattereri TaxID=42514 RepID=UPI001891A098|nr:cytosolic phospholipase A2 gamma-like [Pygocentrus nattereri]
MTASALKDSEVRIGHSLSEAERQHLARRRKTVLQCLEQNGISCSEDKVPNIAVLGSGGGLRAMVGLLGSLCQLKEEGLLDCIMYLCGVSGSTWCMASLYKEPDWSTKLDLVKNDIVQRLADGSVSLKEMGQKLAKYYSEKDHFSLTDVWSALIVSNMVNEIDEHKLTEQRGKYTKDPYPIYTVIDKQCKYDRLNADPWFEITPDESGYSLSGAFVDSSFLGSEFENGKNIKKQPEIDMLYLQGLCGSALADMEVILKKLQELITLESADSSVSQSKTREYEDSGLLLNSPYFSVLRKERDIDLIISLDFSEGDPFKTVVQTAEKCKDLQIPFPEVVLPAKNTEPQDFYVFKGSSDAPTVIHIPLFNAVNCKGGIKKWVKTYSTLQMNYSREMITDLLEKAGLNIKNNKEKLLKEIGNVTG